MEDPYYYESVTDAIPCGGYKIAVRFRNGPFLGRSMRGRFRGF